jgi:hypothetical protein
MFIKDGSDWKEKEYDVDADTVAEAEEHFEAHEFVRFTLNSSNEIIPTDVKRIIDGDRPIYDGDDLESGDSGDFVHQDVAIIENTNANLEATELHEVVTAQITDIDGNTIEIKRKDGGSEQWYKVDSKTVYFDEDGSAKTLSDLDKGDFVVFVETDDDAETLDFVLQVISKDDAEEKDILDAMEDEFLKPNYIVPIGEKSGTGNTDTDFATVSEKSKTPLANIYLYVVKGTLASKEDGKKVTVKYGNETKEVTTKDGGKFTIELSTEENLSSVTLTVDGKNQTVKF